MDLNRAALFAYKLKLSPETQPIRQTVIDEITLRKLELCAGAEGSTIGNINSYAPREWPWPSLPLNETRASLERLETAGLAESKVVRKKRRWTIAQSGQDRIGRERIVAEETVDGALRTLFGQAQVEAFKDAFLKALTALFDQIAKNYVESTFGQSEPTAPVLLAPALDEITATIAAENPELDARAFADGLNRFFREQSPDFDRLKWVYCQNYYLVRMLGMDEAADVLSREIFSGSQVYLDTNVLIELLDPGSPQRRSLEGVMASLRKAGARLCVLRITLQELDKVFSREVPNLEAVLRQIPDGTIGKVRGALARAEALHRQDPAKPSARALVGLFANAEERLKTEMAVEVVDEAWFVEAAPSVEIIDRANALRRHYDRRLLRKKRPDAAVHDALALTWIGRQSVAGGKMVCFLTLDLSLPTFKETGWRAGQRVAVSLDALVPWLGAVVGPQDGELSAAYSAVLVNQLLTVSTRFSLQDFRLLAELGMECSKLPADDVESCLVHLRREASNVDVSTAEGREQIHHAVRRFFASPDLRYLKELTELRGQIESHNQDLLALRQEKRALSKALDEEKEGHKRELEQFKEREARRRVMNRLIVSACLLLVLEAAALLVAIKDGSGENAWQKVGSMWWLLGVPWVVIVPFFRWLCGRELWPTAKRLLWVWSRE
jgi:predicted nucleic acid-binding protein